MGLEAPKFQVGQIVQHLKFGYRGVIYSVDRQFQQSEDWYQTMAISRPPRDFPWYQVLVDNTSYTTYVAERNLSTSKITAQIDHPRLGQYFSRYNGDRYIARKHC